ncbi:MAG: response regulator [Tannerellaceae bacterium]|jgi:DNA-binding NarL/FixJ family response regulator|nr:response regulator [Tannerellaceae bacterium]
MTDIHITDDDAMVVELLIPVLNDSGIACVTGSSFTLSECRKAPASACPDVLLLDINMPDGNGIVFCTEMHARYPQMKIVWLTGHSEHSSVMQMLKSGASGYLPSCRFARNRT